MPPVERRAPLWAVVLLSAAGYGLMAVWFPLWPHVGRVPLADIRAFAPTLFAGLLYVALVAALYGLYWVGFRRATVAPGRWTLAAVLAVAALFALPLLFVYPINATDIYRYVIAGRVASVYGQSPFAAPPSAFVGDPFIPLAGEWAGETSPYGPLWEVVAAALTALSGDNLLLGVLLFKLLALGCFLGIGGLVWALLAGQPGRAAYTLLWAWNPALLLIFVVDGHNDALMLLWLVLGLWIARRGRREAGFLVMCLAALTKPVAVLVLPVFLIAFWRETPANRLRWRLLAVAVLGGAALAWLAFLPWAAPGRLWQTPLELALRLAREATSVNGFSPAVWAYFALGGRVSIEAIGAAARALFAVFAVVVLWWAWRGRPALRGAADLFLGYMAQALSFRIWYTVWPFPWLLLDGAESPSPAAGYRLRAGLWFLLLAQLSVVWYGHARVFLWGGSQAAAHLIGVPLVFLLPWVLALLPDGWKRAGLTHPS